jgi:hypothetical protein
MEYRLERKVKINREPEFKSLNSWCLNEFDEKGEKIGLDWVPFSWRFWFTGTSLQLVTNLNIERDFETEKTKSAKSKTIYGKFYSGICVDGTNLIDEVTFSIFGTARKIKEFSVIINEVKEGNEETCIFTAFPSYVSEDAEFRKVIEDDYAGFEIYINSEKFNGIAKLIESRSIDSARLYIKYVDGVYAYWTPTIKTYSAKFLTSEVVVDDVGETKFEGTRVNKVGEFDISFSTRVDLELKQNLPSVDMTKEFEKSYEVEIEQDDSNLIHKSDASNTVNLQPLIRVVKSLKVAMWFVFGALLLLISK